MDPGFQSLEAGPGFLVMIAQLQDPQPIVEVPRPDRWTATRLSPCVTALRGSTNLSYWDPSVTDRNVTGHSLELFFFRSRNVK